METLLVRTAVLRHGHQRLVERDPLPPCSLHDTSTRTVLTLMHTPMMMLMVCTRALQPLITPGPFSALLVVHRCHQHLYRPHQCRPLRRQLLQAGNHVPVGCAVIPMHQWHNIVLMVNNAKNVAQQHVNAQVVVVVVGGNLAVAVFAAILMRQSLSIVLTGSSVKSVEVMLASVLVQLSFEHQCGWFDEFLFSWVN